MSHHMHELDEKPAFEERLQTLDEDALFKEADRYIWLSAYANSNPRSSYHWRCDAVYAECRRRERVDIYENAHAHIMRQEGLA